MNDYGKVTPEVLQALESIVGSKNVSTSAEELEKHSVDESPLQPHKPEVVVKPNSTEEVSAIMEVFAHAIGFTDIEDNGQEGLEFAYNDALKGAPGLRRVIRDGRRWVVKDVESIRAPQPGRDLVLSIDRRLQYLAYRELKAAMQANRARSGSVVVLDIATGEVLAMVNQPTFNPNDREQYAASRYRNRATNDVFEPGSSIKPFAVAAALEAGTVHADSVIDTSPGMLRVGASTVKDKHNLGPVDVTTVLARSSNVGVVKIAQTLKPEQMWDVLDHFGFGRVTGSGFPGESAGILPPPRHWRPINQATISYGYGLSVTALQLAQAYAVLGSGGIRRPVSLRRVDAAPEGERVLGADGVPARGAGGRSGGPDGRLDQAPARAGVLAAPGGAAQGGSAPGAGVR